MDQAGLALPVRRCRDAFAPGVSFLFTLLHYITTKITFIKLKLHPLTY